MTTWFVSDTHFFHGNIISFCNRPFNNVEEMNETLIENWNDYVQPHDVVYHLGDVCLGIDMDKDEELLRQTILRLNGYIHLIPGNHDTKRKLDIFKDYWTIESPLLYLKHPNVVLCHFPLQVWYNCHNGTPHLHGHSHGTLEPLGKRLDVGVDCEPGYMRPKAWEELKDVLDQMSFIKQDHHGG